MSSNYMLNRRTALKALTAGTLMAALGPRTGWAAETTLAKAKASGVLTVGISNERPYAYVDTDGSLKGAIPEVLQAALKDQGIAKLEAQIVDFNALIPGLNAGRFDIIGSGMYIRPKRCEVIAFTNPITQAGGALVVRGDSTVSPKGLDDLAKLPNFKVGTQSGTAQVEELTKAGVARGDMVLFAREDEAVSGLLAKRTDGIYFPALQANEILKKFPDSKFKRIDGFTTALNYQAFGLRKGDDDLREALNAGIAKIIADGSLLKIIEQHGYGKTEIPDPAMTAEKLCSA